MIEFDPVLVHEWLTRTARCLPEKTALICGEDRWTYGRIDQYTNRLAYTLRKLGVKRHDRVVILLDNCAETVISLYGILKAGAAFTILAASVKGDKLNYILKNSNAHTIITHVSKAGVIAKALQRNPADYQVIWVGDESEIPEGLVNISHIWQSLFSNAVVSNETQDKTLPRCIDRDLATLIYTSGSTGEPKGVITPHRNMISAARSIIQYLDNRQDDIILNVLPLSFDYGLYQVIMAFMFGGTVVLEKSFVYLHPLLERIGRERVTGFPIVPTILAMLLKMQNVNTYDFSSLRYITNTGAALPVEHIRNLREILPHVTIYSMFGLTECKRVGYLPPENIDRKPDSVGIAMPNCEVFVVDKDGKPVEPGQTGELVIRGSNVMSGYWNDPEMTARTYRPGRIPGEKWLYSGDYFRQDEDDFLYFLGRRDDMIKSKGERISAKEVESTICRMEGVSEVAIVGLPDEILGQAIKAFIVPMSQVQLTVRQVQKFCTENLESFMVPKYIEFTESLPKTAHGKIDKKQLAAYGKETAKS